MASAARCSAVQCNAMQRSAPLCRLHCDQHALYVTATAKREAPMRREGMGLQSGVAAVQRRPINAPQTAISLLVSTRRSHATLAFRG